jgi:hypothetical protein
MLSLTCFGITLPSSGNVPSVFWDVLNWVAVARILWMGVLCLVTWCVAISDRHAHPQYSIDCSSIEHLSEGTSNAPWGWECNVETCRRYHTQLINWMDDWCICWLFTRIFNGVLIFKGLTARRLYKSFGVKGFLFYVVADIMWNDGDFLSIVWHKQTPYKTEVRTIKSKYVGTVAHSV